MLISRVLMVLLTLLGFTFNNNDLRRRNAWDDYKRNLNFWVTRNMGIVAWATIIILITIFAIVCFMIVGISATGDTIYSLQKVV